MSFTLTRHRAALAGGVTTVLLLSACGAAASTDVGTTSASTPPDVAAATGSQPTMTMPAQAPGASSSSAAAAPAATDAVAIQNYAFGPHTITVRAGTTVTWTQQDEDSHTVTADDNSYSSQPMSFGQTYTHTFAAPGTYTYHCSIHPTMHGTVVVTNG